MAAFACFFFFNDTATTEIYTLSLHDALPIWERPFADLERDVGSVLGAMRRWFGGEWPRPEPNNQLQILGSALLRDRKSTRLNSSHDQISYAVFCLKKKKNNQH